jgi:hypothetical protein
LLSQLLEFSTNFIWQYLPFTVCVLCVAPCFIWFLLWKKQAFKACPPPPTPSNMPENRTHSLREVDSSTSWQSFCCTSLEPPSPTTLSQHFCCPLKTHHEDMDSDIQATREVAPIELLPVEIFGMLYI